MPVYELLCLSFASCCLPSNCLQAMADGLQSCLSPVQSISTPPLATSSSHSSWAGSCKGWQELARKGRYVTATGTTNHYIQNTLNAALRLNAAELVLSFTERKPATPGLLTTFSCSSLPFGPRTAVQGSPKAEQHVAPCLFWDSGSWNSCPAGLPAQLPTDWGWYSNRFPRGAWVHPSVFPPAKLE